MTVAVAPGAAELDEAALRARIGAELHAEAVAPGDSRAPSAKGLLVIDIDPAGKRLTVTWQAHATPLERSVTLPSDVLSARDAVVVLAGNLARDEASDLAAELRRRHAPEPAPVATPPSNPAPPAVGADTEEIRLQATLDEYARRDRRLATAIGWTTLSVGFAGMGAGAWLTTQHDQVAGAGAVTVGAGLALGGLLTLVLPSGPFEEFADYQRRGAGAQATLNLWTREAGSEHRRRKTAAVAELVLSGVSLGAAIAFLPPGLLNRAGGDFIAPSFLVLSAAAGITGMYFLSSDGPIEEALHLYEKSSGRAPMASVLGHVGMTPTVGGALFGVSGIF